MSYRTDDERDELIRFIRWLSTHGFLVGEATAKKRLSIVEGFLKERQVEREWGKKDAM